MEERVKILLEILTKEKKDIEKLIVETQNKGEFSKMIFLFEEWKTTTIKIDTLKEVL